ncbi:MAG: DUF4132 domain-containing protein [Pseudomonadota bacterium]
MVAYEPSAEILAKIADLLGADHPYLTERADFDELLARYASECAALVFEQRLGGTEPGKQILGLSQASGEALLLLVLEHFHGLACARAGDELWHKLDAYQLLFERFLPVRPAPRDGLLRALIVLQGETLNSHANMTIHFIMQALLAKGIMRGTSSELLSDFSHLVQVVAKVEKNDWWYQSRLTLRETLTYLSEAVPEPSEFILCADEVEQELDSFFTEAEATDGYRQSRPMQPKTLESGCRILGRTASDRGCYVLPLWRSLLVRHVTYGHSAVDTISILRPLLRTSAPRDPESWIACINLMPQLWQMDYAPYPDFLSALERWQKANEMPAEMRYGLRRWRDAVNSDWTTQRGRGLIDRMTRLIEGVRDEPVLEKSAWGETASAWLNSLPTQEQAAWAALLTLARAAGERPKPSAKWTKEMAEAIGKVGQQGFRTRVLSWLEDFPLDPASPDPNTNMIKGLIWGLANDDGAAAAYPLGAFARRAFTKVPNLGARSTKLGNAAVLSLGLLKGLSGIVQLCGLQARVRYPSARAQIEKALDLIVQREGIGSADVEELGVPTLDLEADGRRLVPLGEHQAELAITGSESAALTWITSDGKRQKSVPAAVKRDHAGALKALRRDLKELRDTLRIQRLRLETLMVEERSWDYATWRERYGVQPLLSPLCRRLIWRFESDGAAQSALPGEDGLLTAEGEALAPDPEATGVSLWHPIDATVEEVRAWRTRLRDLEITQPFKQAHREIYILTEAERQTETYSNRFAGHVIRQHQFRALCQQRAWAYELQGSWDSHNTPTRAVPDLGLTATFVVDAPEPDGEASDRWSDEGATGFPFLTTDRVQFLEAAHGPITLESVPPRLFSELMRDVDLFVSLTSVGNNPEWFDGGPDGQFAAYWRGYAFGELGALAETRREVLAEILPKLKISEQLTLGERFLEVRGRLRTYKIHLRSANILMDFNDQYLCIVPGRAEPKTGPGLRLPFEGDPVISLILSKAILLAADDKIKDPMIAQQIRSGLPET